MLPVSYVLAPIQDLDEIPKAEAVRALKHCEWEALPGMDDCVALEGSISYFAYSWVAGESSWTPRSLDSVVLQTHSSLHRVAETPMDGRMTSGQGYPLLLPHCRTEGTQAISIPEFARITSIRPQYCRWGLGMEWSYF